MPQTRRRRRIRYSGDSTWPVQEQMPGGSSSHASAPQPPTCVNWDDDMDDFMPPKPWPPTHDVPPLYMNLEPEKRQRERQEVHQVMLHHLQHKLVLTGMTTWMTSCPLNHGLQHMMFPPYMNVDPEKRERERQEVRRAILHHLQHHHLSTGMTT